MNNTEHGSNNKRENKPVAAYFPYSAALSPALENPLPPGM